MQNKNFTFALHEPAHFREQRFVFAVTESFKVLPAEIKEKTQEGKKYQIKAGDTLGKIAKAHKPDDMNLKDAISLLAKYNQIKDANNIQAGRVIRLPLVSGKLDADLTKFSVQVRTQTEIENFKKTLSGSQKVKIQEVFTGALDKANQKGKGAKINKYLSSNSVVDMLNLLGVDSSFANRKVIYKEVFGKAPPAKSAEMNLALLRWLKGGVVAQPVQPVQPQPVQPALTAEQRAQKKQVEQLETKFKFETTGMNSGIYKVEVDKDLVKVYRTNNGKKEFLKKQWKFAEIKGTTYKTTKENLEFFLSTELMDSTPF